MGHSRRRAPRPDPLDSALVRELAAAGTGSATADDALYEWGILLFSTDRTRAAPILRRALEIAPKHKLADEAKKLLGEGRAD